MGALPDIQGSLRSYALDESELEAASKGELDVVTGVMIIDDDTRMVILEGLAAPGGGMQSIYMDLPRPKVNPLSRPLSGPLSGPYLDPYLAPCQNPVPQGAPLQCLGRLRCGSYSPLPCLPTPHPPGK
jgi:hypothetical protein